MTKANQTQRARIEGTTTYRKSVKAPMIDILKPGSNNKKLGYKVTKGRWKGKYLYSLTLEERATCPTYCHHWDDCYGNNMPFAHRFTTGSRLLFWIGLDIAERLRKHPNGIVIRLHVLGDFYSTGYVQFWADMLEQNPNLCVFGYTARWGDDIQDAIHTQLNLGYPDRCVIRYSRNKEYDETSTTARYATGESFNENNNSARSFDCPEQSGKVASCAACGACWGEHCTKSVRFKTH